MSLAFSLAIFFMMWWIILFAMLPFGMRRTQEEAGEVIPGSEASAPERPRMLRVLLMTTVVTCVLFAGYMWLRSSGFGLDDIPFFMPPSESYSTPSG
jgi:predicted secreted protein